MDQGHIAKLAEFALSQPQACYTAYTFGLKHRWTYFLTSLPDIQDLLESLENAISHLLIPAITERKCNQLDRNILAPVRDIPSTCACGEAFTVDHSMICKLGDFITQCHNELRDLEAEFLSMVCSDAEIEPVLQDISGEHLNRGSNKAQDAKLDIRARGFWERHQSAFFDMRVCNPNAVSYRDLEPQQIYRIHENEKKLLYSKRVLDIEHGTLVFTTTGGMGKECLMYHSRLEQLIAIKRRGAVCQNHLIDQNQSKCKYQCITRKKSPVQPTYNINETPLESCDTEKHLGVWVSSNLTSDKQVTEQCAKANKPLGFVHRASRYVQHHKAPKRVVHFIFLSSGAISAMQPKYARHSPLAY